MRVKHNGGLCTAWIDCRGQIGAYAGHTEAFQKEWGGEQTYRSRSGLSGEGWINPRRPVKEIGIYRTDVVRPDRWIAGGDFPEIRFGKHSWQLFAPVNRDGVDREWPVVAVNSCNSDCRWHVLACRADEVTDALAGVRTWEDHEYEFCVWNSNTNDAFVSRLRWSHANWFADRCGVDLMRFILAIMPIAPRDTGWHPCPERGPCCEKEDLADHEYQLLKQLGIHDTGEGRWIRTGRYDEVIECHKRLSEFSVFVDRTFELVGWFRPDWELPNGVHEFWRYSGFGSDNIDAIRIDFRSGGPYLDTKQVSFTQFDDLREWYKR